MPGFYWNIKDFTPNENKYPTNYIASSEGKIFEVRKSDLGMICVETNRIPSLDLIREGFHYPHRIIPSWVISQTLAFFQNYCHEDDPIEVMVKLLYSPTDDEYRLICPEQYVSDTYISVPDIIEYDRIRYIEVLDIHSHNVMDAFFSPTDNADEVQFRMYGVIGKVNTQPEMKLRVGVGGKFIALNLLKVFESDTLVTNGDYPSEWDNAVHRI